jgi:hypothetical protein
LTYDIAKGLVDMKAEALKGSEGNKDVMSLIGLLSAQWRVTMH